jgi:hypothetical protein
MIIEQKKHQHEIKLPKQLYTSSTTNIVRRENAATSYFCICPRLSRVLQQPARAGLICDMYTDPQSAVDFFLLRLNRFFLISFSPPAVLLASSGCVGMGLPGSFSLPDQNFGFCRRLIELCLNLLRPGRSFASVAAVAAAPATPGVVGGTAMSGAGFPERLASSAAVCLLSSRTAR